jgi:diadenosine tetraphosphate (Ap4A) HIT family hydrolase
MAIIFESRNFIVQAQDHPLVDRNDGGHITINPKIKISRRQELSDLQAIELMRLTIVVGEAMEKVLIKNGVDIGRINYQDNGNWSVHKPEGPVLHIHLYGRARNAKFQPYGESLNFPHKDTHPEFYKHLHPLNDKDIADMRSEINDLLELERNRDLRYSLTEQ